MGPTRGLGRALKGLAGTLLSPAEDPRPAETDTVSRQQALIERVRQARARVVAAQQRLERRLDLGRAGLDAFDTQARQALIAGREDLARIALQRRRAAEVEQQALATQLQAIASEGQRLALVEQHLVARLDAWTARREILAARLTAAEIQTGIEDSLAGAAQDVSGFDTALSETEEALHYLQARVAAIDHLTDMGVLEPLDGMTPPHDPSIDAELARIRATIVE